MRLRLLRTVLVLLLLTPATSAFADATRPENHRIDDLSFADADNGVMTGGYVTNNGFASSTTDGGMTWTATRLPNWMTGAASNGSGGWVVPNFGAQLWGSADGLDWQVDDTVPGSDVQPYDVATLQGGRVAVVGQESFSGRTAFVRVLDGASWLLGYRGPVYPPADEFSDPPSTNAQMQAIAAAPGGTVAWAVGNEWKPSSGGDGSTATYLRALAVKTADGGTTWTLQTLPATGGNVVLDVAAPSPTVAVAVGLNRMLFKTVNGATWTGGAGVINRDPVAPTNVNAYSVDALDANRILVGADYGRIGYTSNGATFTYKRLSAEYQGVIRDVDMITDTHWIAVGDNETIYHTFDSGATWSGTTGLKPPLIEVADLTPGSAPAGTADDGKGVGVASIEVAIRNASGQYFNGTTWQAAEVWLDAESEDGWDTWSYPAWTLPNPGTGYSVTARAVDGLGSSTLDLWSSTGTLGTLRGTVRATGGAALSQATVTVDGTTVTTASDGTYTVPGVEPGVYSVTFSKAGFTPQTVSVAIASGTETVRDITLAPALASVVPQRVSAANRFSGSAAIARNAFDADPGTSGTQWNVRNIVIASGEDRAAADPLSAAGLCGVLDAPLLLVHSASVDAEVEKVVREIAAASPEPVKVYIVGGLNSVPDARFTELQQAVGGAGTIQKVRLAEGGTRYDMAAKIARTMRDIDNTTPTTVLVANGADPAKFFDALALSPISAYQAYPILLVSADAVPAATAGVLSEFDPTRVIVGGGPNTVSETVRTQLGAVRWSGSTRYSTALTIADKAVAEAGMSRAEVGVAAVLPDALTGGSAIGRAGGVLVLTNGTTLTPETGTWLSANKAEIDRVRVFGGQASLSETVRTAIAGRLTP